MRWSEQVPAELVEPVLNAARASAERDAARPLSEHAELAVRHRRQSVWHGLTLAGPEVRAYVQVAGVDGGDLSAEGFVVPPARGAGLGGQVAAATLARAGSARPGATLLAWAHGDPPAAARIAQRVGAVRSRELWQLRLPLPLSAEFPIELGDGVTLRRFRPGSDEDAWLALNAAAFADHPEQGRWTARDLSERMETAWFDPNGFLLAERDDQLLGFHWTKVEGSTGEVYVVGVDPSAHGQGLGRALTAAGLNWLGGVRVDERPLREVRLYVDGANRPATAMYASLGFQRLSVDVQYRLSAPQV